MDVSYNTQLFGSRDVIDGLECCGLWLWCFYQLFGLSFWRHPFTADHPLVSNWCNATFLQISSHEETNCFYILNGLGAHFQQIFIFGWTILLNESCRRQKVWLVTCMPSCQSSSSLGWYTAYMARLTALAPSRQ